MVAQQMSAVFSGQSTYCIQTGVHFTVKVNLVLYVWGEKISQASD